MLGVWASLLACGSTSGRDQARYQQILALEGDAEAAALTYSARCGSCHQADPRWGMARGRVVDAVLSGAGFGIFGNPKMPPQGSELSDQQIADLASLISQVPERAADAGCADAGCQGDAGP